ncbi:hypothetical protein M2336_002810 [Sphingobium sp. B1D7B]|nr:hypothetical protein [Sphingobium sp. B1D7B]
MQTAFGPFGMRGAAPLPCAGGWQEQPAALMDCFAALDDMTATKD